MILTKPMSIALGVLAVVAFLPAQANALTYCRSVLPVADGIEFEVLTNAGESNSTHATLALDLSIRNSDLKPDVFTELDDDSVFVRITLKRYPNKNAAGHYWSLSTFRLYVPGLQSVSSQSRVRLHAHVHDADTGDLLMRSPKPSFDYKRNPNFDQVNLNQLYNFEPGMSQGLFGEGLILETVVEIDGNPDNYIALNAYEKLQFPKERLDVILEKMFDANAAKKTRGECKTTALEVFNNS